MKPIRLIFASFILFAISTDFSVAQSKFSDGALAFEGFWDFGSCYGDDTHMCRDTPKTPGGVGCIKAAPVCASGQAKAVATHEGDQRCVIQWWRWECSSDQTSSIDQGTEAQSRYLNWRSQVDDRMREHRITAAAARARGYPKNPCLEHARPIVAGKRIATIAYSTYVASDGATPFNWTLRKEEQYAFISIEPSLLAEFDAFNVIVSAYEPVMWSFDPALAAKTRAVIATGRFQQRFSALPRNIPLEMNTLVDDEPKSEYCRIHPMRGNYYRRPKKGDDSGLNGYSRRRLFTDIDYFLDASTDAYGSPGSGLVIREKHKFEIAPRHEVDTIIITQ